MKLVTYSQIEAAWNSAAARVYKHRARLLFCLRMTIAAAASLALVRIFALPFHGLWAVLTAVAVMQVSVGGSLRATSEYVVGTLCGVAYASAIGFFFPHTGPVEPAAALIVAPLGLAATISPMFRVAPITGVMVLLISSQSGEGPLELGLYRLLEVLLGGAVALAVSLWFFPERAHALGVDAAARILTRFAQDLRKLMEGFTHRIDEVTSRNIQDATGRSIAAFQSLVAEAERERLIGFVPEPHPGPLGRTVLRLRHDVVMIGRAAAEPLPELLAQPLDVSLRRVASACSDYLFAAARALSSQASAPSLDSVETALDDYACEIAALRQAGCIDSLSSAELERLFALGFGLDQLHQHFRDLGRCVEEWAGGSSGRAKTGSMPRSCVGAAAETR